MPRLICLSFAALLLVIADSASAAYPNRPIRLVVPFPPGGGLDVLGRAVAMQVETQLGQNIIVDNRGGANGVIGTEIVANAPADGYTLMNNGAAAVLAQILNRKLPFDLERDFTPVTSLGHGTGYLVLVNASSPAHTVKELIALAKSKSNHMSYGSAGVGNPNHLAMALFAVRAGFNAVHVPYKGTAPSITAVMSGEVQFTSTPPSAALPQVKNGRLRAIAFTGASRAAALPDVPTVAEAGVPDYTFSGGFVGWHAPAGTPAAVVNRLQQEVHKALLVPRVRDAVENGGYSIGGESPTEFGRYVHEQLGKYKEAAEAAGLQAE